jgi:hypothetical protein
VESSRKITNSHLGLGAAKRKADVNTIFLLAIYPWLGIFTVVRFLRRGDLNNYSSTITKPTNALSNQQMVRQCLIHT